MSDKTKKYRLYALPMNEESVRKAERESFSRITVDIYFCLLDTDIHLLKNN